MDQQNMLSYLSEVQALENDIRADVKTQSDLLELIEAAKEIYQDNSDSSSFFNAELSFHKGDHEQALKEYVQAKSIPMFQFFCFRASAIIAKKRGHNDQALRFAQKASTIQPTDVTCKTLLSELQCVDSIPPILEDTTTPPDDLFSLETNLNSADVTAHLLQDVTIPMSSPLSNSGLPPSNANLTKNPYAFETNTPSTNTIYPEVKPMLTIDPPQTCNFTANLLSSTENALDDRIQSFQRQRAQCLTNYVKQARQRSQKFDDCFIVFNGWENRPHILNASQEYQDSEYAHFLLSNAMRKPSCGVFFRWNGKGIALNPGKRFLEQFHKHGLHLTDIDIVVVTQTDPDSYADIKEIYELNYQLNKISSELQIIHYYLNHKAFLELSPILKPNFKQERNAIHCLELFVDSPDVEKIELTPEITLNYFPTSTQEALSHHHSDKIRPQRNLSSPLGARFDLKPNMQNGETRRTLKIGYISGTAWSPLLGHHLGVCDILFAGFGHTSANDFSKLNYNESSLGYFGTCSLSEEVKPQLLLCCEFDGRDGDIRLEVSKKMRQDVENRNTSEEYKQVILPADNGLYMDLKNQQIRCSVSNQLVDPSQVRVVKSGEAFSKLLYVSPNCFLE